MGQTFYQLRSRYLQRLATILLLITGWFFGSHRMNAQPGFPPCEPPQPGESLLLVVTATDENQQQVLDILPPQVTPTACQYLENIVLRVEGFPSINAAGNWAEYINRNFGLSAFVAVPPGESEVSQDSPTIAIDEPYNPQLLGSGYAVLVDYFNNPQVAAELQQVLEQTVGLVSYEQRPYLLAEFSPNQNTAKQVLQTLSDRGFWVLMVDASGVMVLRSEVTVGP